MIYKNRSSTVPTADDAAFKLGEKSRGIALYLVNRDTLVSISCGANGTSVVGTFDIIRLMGHVVVHATCTLRRFK